VVHCNTQKEKGYHNVLAGDFNDEMKSDAIRHFKNFPNLMVNCNYSLVGMRKDAGIKEPFITTMKFREPKMTKRIIDYVFASPELEVSGALDAPAEEDIDQYIGNPAFNHPSDHYAQAYSFILP